MVAGFGRHQNRTKSRKGSAEGALCRGLKSKWKRGEIEAYSIRCLAITSKLKLTMEAQT